MTIPDECMVIGNSICDYIATSRDIVKTSKTDQLTSASTMYGCLWPDTVSTHPYIRFRHFTWKNRIYMTIISLKLKSQKNRRSVSCDA